MNGGRSWLWQRSGERYEPTNFMMVWSCINVLSQNFSGTHWWPFDIRTVHHTSVGAYSVLVAGRTQPGIPAK
ncbi:hypothetical protein TNCV_5021191 [Trichonephila clavipes]|nr:hypothetical protein TNCV_5021191 [Trichonephila clavipes]